jgi:hypothetical protein
MRPLILNENQIPDNVKKMFWKFIRDDMLVREFEIFIYGDAQLKTMFSRTSYEDLLMLDYELLYTEVKELAHALFELVIEFPDDCICETFPSSCRIYIGSDINERYIETLPEVAVIKSFSGQSPWNKNWLHYYHAASVRRCEQCQTWWIVTFEESDCDYYFTRLSDQDVEVILQNPTWPNDCWPAGLRDWDDFSKRYFENWQDLYEKYDNRRNEELNFFEDYYFLNAGGKRQY